MADGSSNSHGITFWGALQVMLIGLKLADLIDWEWKLVLLPLEIYFVLIALCLFVIGLSAFFEYRGRY